MREITAAVLSTLLPAEVDAVEQEWRSRSADPEYPLACDRASDALFDLLGEGWVEPTEPFMSITSHGESLNLPSGVIYAARWAYAAVQARDEITGGDFATLTAAWSVLP